MSTQREKIGEWLELIENGGKILVTFCLAVFLCMYAYKKIFENEADIKTLESRSDKRYKRGLEIGEGIRNKIKDLEHELHDEQLKNAQKDGEFSQYKEDHK